MKGANHSWEALLIHTPVERSNEVFHGKMGLSSRQRDGENVCRPAIFYGFGRHFFCIDFVWMRKLSRFFVCGNYAKGDGALPIT